MDFTSDEMFRSVSFRFFSTVLNKMPQPPKAKATKAAAKTASLKAPVVKKEDEPELDLETALKQKRDISLMAKDYNPFAVEKYWYTYWKQNKYFHADAQKALEVPHEKRFTICLPPPNVTGYLHIGHALTAAIEDTLVRWHRMKGDVTCWLPGLDHAGIGTQSVVERMLYKEGIDKHDLGREKFLEKVWEWKHKHGDRIHYQFEKLGASIDWDRMVFTMDDKLSKGVSEAFVRLFEKGLIYRSYRLVNWCCKLQTALSDVEVEYEDLDKPTLLSVPGHDGKYEFGVLIQFAYKVKGTDKEIIVATTRIETMLGDTAVAVHSKDARYQEFIGKELEHPFIPDRKIKVITDDELVDPAFGTGAVKITPAHDHNDFKCGTKNNLENVNILNNDGTINENGGPYKGMKRFDVRNQIIKDLEAKGLFRGKLNNPMRLGFCHRSGDVIEPLLRPQWYVNCAPIQEKMLEVVRNKELEILPSMYEPDWFKWIENIKDWCISRQLWWGHRCPVYLVTIRELGITPNDTDEKHWIAANSAEEALEKASKKYGVDKSKIELKQDEDVLDTWFSSGLFPFSSFGWPNDNPDLQAFYPGHLLETGHDILFFWVAKMVLMSLILNEKLPFKQVYLHNIVRDKDGEKMSKSKGNVIDPLDIIEGATLESLVERLNSSALSKAEIQKGAERRKEEYPEGIPACGTDALRYGLLAYSIQARYINMDVKRMISNRLFMNKIWNSFKFAMTNIPTDFKYDISELKVDNLPLVDRWILSKLENLIATMNKQLEEFKFGELTIAFSNFWLYEFCDVYLEAIKPRMRSATEARIPQLILFTIFDQGLRLLHPLMPFISEELYQKLPQWSGKIESICIAPYPTGNGWNLDSDSIEKEFNFVFDVVKSIRSLCSSVNVPNNVKANSFINFLPSVANPEAFKKLVEAEQEVIATLAKSGKVTVLSNSSEVPKGCIVDIASNTAEVYVNVSEHINIRAEITRLEKKIEENNKFIDGIKKKTSAADYETKVPEKVKKQNAEKLEGYTNDNAKLNEALDNFKKLL